jgi:hypothetical protein
MKTTNNMWWYAAEHPTDPALACGWVAPTQCQGRRELVNPYRLGGGWRDGKRYANHETVCVTIDLFHQCWHG